MKKHLRGLDGLRGIAAISVLSGHVWQHSELRVRTPGVEGWIYSHLEQGLTLFFVLSGFLLYLPIVTRQLAGEKRERTVVFYRKRLLRIFPAYLVVLVLSSIVLKATYKSGPTADSLGVVGALDTPLLWVANLSLTQALIPLTMGTGLGVSWSLTTEMTFYAVLPLLAVFSSSTLRATGQNRMRLFWSPIALVVVGFSFQLWGQRARSGSDPQRAYELSWGQTWQAVVDRSLLSTAFMFAFGMAAAVAVGVLRRSTSSLAQRWRRWLLLGSGIGAVVAIAILPASVGFSLLSAFAILACCLPRPTETGDSLYVRTLESRPIRTLGLLSYSIYLWHLPVLNWLTSRDFFTLDAERVALFVNWLLVFAISLVLSTMTYFLVEGPFMRLRHRSRSAKTSK